MEGSMGPVVGVVVAIIILGLIAGVIGRMCSGRSVMCRRNYDCEAWIEQKCSTCIDGRVDPPTQRQQHHPQPRCQPPQQQSMPYGVDEETESHVSSSEESLPELERHQAPVSLPDQQQQHQQIHQHEDRPETSRAGQNNGRHGTGQG